MIITSISNPSQFQTKLKIFDVANVTVLCSIEDITDEQTEIAKLVELCNAEKLEIEHLQNMVDDFLCVRR